MVVDPVCGMEVDESTPYKTMIYSVSSALRFALGMEPTYVIEVISERFDMLDTEGRESVLIHELLHIPRRFTGGLRPHGKYVNGREVSRLRSMLEGRCLDLL